jgi:hypothetical protein
MFHISFESDFYFIQSDKISLHNVTGLDQVASKFTSDPANEGAKKAAPQPAVQAFSIVNKSMMKEGPSPGIVSLCSHSNHVH